MQLSVPGYRHSRGSSTLDRQNASKHFSAKPTLPQTSVHLSRTCSNEANSFPDLEKWFQVLALFYPVGDPRGKLLLELTAEVYPQSPAVLLAQSVTEETNTLLGERPTVFLGLSPWLVRWICRLVVLSLFLR